MPEWRLKVEHLEPFKQWLDGIGVEYKVPKHGNVVLSIAPRTRETDRPREWDEIKRVKYSRKWLHVGDYGAALVLRFYRALIEARAELEAKRIASAARGLEYTSFSNIKGKRE